MRRPYSRLTALMLLVATRAATSASLPSWWPVWDAPSQTTFLSAQDEANWSFGAFGGVYNHGRLTYVEFEPWRVSNQWADGYMVSADAVYKIAVLAHVPLDLELDVSAGYLFGQGSLYEVTALPVLRWKWFPWNNFIYTNARWGALGASYTTHLSSLEASDTTHMHTSRFLNSDVAEWVFAPREQSAWEVFLRNQHRSGIYGLINGVIGGSNYVCIGFRRYF